MTPKQGRTATLAALIRAGVKPRPNLNRPARILRLPGARRR